MSNLIVNANGLTLTQTARQFLFVREAAVNNTGLRVNGIQTWSGGQLKDSWCCEALTMWLDLWFQGASPIPRLQACEDVYQLAKKNEWLIDVPEVECIVINVDLVTGIADHIALCTCAVPLTTIAGNTSANGVSVNGDRVGEHPIDRAGKVFVRIPRPS